RPRPRRARRARCRGRGRRGGRAPRGRPRRCRSRSARRSGRPPRARSRTALRRRPPRERPSSPWSQTLDGHQRVRRRGIRASMPSFASPVTAAPAPRRWKALGLVCAAFFMTILDVSIVNVALPSIGRALNFTRDNLQWVITMYAITFGGFLLLGGRAADLLGRRRVFMSGLVVFTASSLACGLATSESFLIVARGFQGLGAAIVSPAVLSIIMTLFVEGPERNKALGIYGAVGGSGAAVGVIAGGILTK